ELFREVLRDARCTPGEEIYSANRLVDLLHGPLGQPGQALVQLRRLADRYKNSIVGERALQALRSLKAVAAERDAGRAGEGNPPAGVDAASEFRFEAGFFGVVERRGMLKVPQQLDSRRRCVDVLTAGASGS